MAKKENVKQDVRWKAFWRQNDRLFGMRKGDRLYPIVSVTVYYGEQAWDGPLC